MSMASARAASLPLQASLLGLVPVLSAIDSVSWLCGGPGLEPKGGRGRAVLNFRPSFGAVTIFS